MLAKADRIHARAKEHLEEQIRDVCSSWDHNHTSEPVDVARISASIRYEFDPECEHKDCYLNAVTLLAEMVSLAVWRVINAEKDAAHA